MRAREISIKERLQLLLKVFLYLLYKEVKVVTVYFMRARELNAGVNKGEF